MKKLLFYTAPFFGVLAIFAGVVLFLNQNLGKGALQVTSVPKSQVYLNGQLIGETPLSKRDPKDGIPIGNYRIRLVPKEGNSKSYDEQITINKSTLTVVDRTFGESASGSVITLTPLSNKKETEVMVISFPDKTNIFLDNNPEGKTPILLKNVTESDHELKLAKEGYLDKTLRIRATSGFRLKSVVFLSVNPNVASFSAQTSLSVPQTPKVAKVTILDTPTGFLRVRADSSIASLEIGRVSPGDSLELVGEKEGWFEIKMTNGKTGWISSQYARKE
ncbi:MAG: hypothetical protein A3H50_00190 [Candidatus Levybacteria bacterium RIFCSPLOWO2_02_FULL_37_10]|nr:MAG: hypothetical protein A2860_03890 [Candidatus Levybacteria bacterium RIFCSPHIGHO2_01_FULL_37_33]OGH32386.1 MAG: hypothetical protein A2953_01930 [Candidatus Levybacteria bacterium RIFCSPLOWO2_01_FULL_36_54]OGH46293.1 MAG: hypothetical protein A3H50_00190 [Candidatus Levybacteria bacterium RIFCSPLOWO2_02_FULL_37_10]